MRRRTLTLALCAVIGLVPFAPTGGRSSFPRR
jgi:hypothetical protein